MSYPPNERRIRSRHHGTTGRRGTARAALSALAVASALVLVGCSGQQPGDGTATPHEAARTTPRVTSVTPERASVIGQTVTINGTGLQGVKRVAFGSTSVRVTAAGPDKVVAHAPAAADYQQATVSLKLIGSGGKTVASKPRALEYTAVGGVGAQLQYALAHWNDYNTAQYGDLNPAGGDCANFVSQTLIARGWTMNDDWYNRDAGGEWSPAWGYVPAMDAYFADNADALGLQELSFSPADRAKVALGDVAVFDWDGDGSPDHVEVVDRITKVDGQYRIELASHNDDYDYRDLDETITTQHPGATGHFWHLTR